MPYCTIEEAWSTSLNPELQDKNYLGKSELGYHNVQLEGSEIYGGDGKQIRCPEKKTVSRKKIPNMSRTYNRLNEHSGPKSRFKKGNGEKRVVIDNTKHILDDSQNHPNYNNGDIPINDYNNSMYETLDNEYRKSGKKIENSSMMEDFVDGNSDSSGSIQGDNIKILNLEKENLELKRIIAELKNNTINDKDNFLDVFTYVFTGVVMILLLENLTKLSRKF
jgi:hypothetical protein